MALIQTTLAPLIPIGGVKPDLVLLLVLAWGATSPSRDAGMWGLGGGLFLDTLSGLPFGTHTIALGALGLITDLLEADFFRSNIVTPLVTTFIATVLYYSLILGLFQFFGRPVDWASLIPRVILPTAVVNTVLMPLVLTGLRRLARYGEHELRI